MPSVKWAHGSHVRIGEWLTWTYQNRAYRGQVAEINAEKGTVVIDGDDKNRWHFRPATNELVRRFPIPLQP